MSDRIRPSQKAVSFTESVIREMTRLAMEHDAINLSQGFPDFAAPEEVKEAARKAIADDVNQYPITWGAEGFREALARNYRDRYGMTWVEAGRDITVTCGSTEAMIAAMLGVLDPGDEVVVFEPFYENYGPDTIISGAVPRMVTLHAPDWTFDEEELAAAFNERTRGIVINTPNNPTGKVFSREELDVIAGLCQKWGTVVVHRRDLRAHPLRRRRPRAARRGAGARGPNGHDQRAVEDVRGDRLARGMGGGAGAALPRHPFRPRLPDGRGAGTTAGGRRDRPRPAGGVLPADRRRVSGARDCWIETLRETGFGVEPPAGAYYVMADISGFGFPDDVRFARHMVEDVGVAVVPGSSFFARPELGSHLVRFAFCKKLETLKEAGERLRGLRPRVVR